MVKKKLGDFIEEYSVKNKNNKPYPVYSISNSIGFCTEYFNKDVSSKNKRTYKIVPKGYFAYNPSRINVGSIDYQRFEDYVIVSPLYVVFKTKNSLKQEYLKYFFKSNYGMHLINSNTSGSVRASLKFNVLSEFKVNFGSVEEQNKVIKVLNNLKDVLNNLESQLALYDELIKSRFNGQEVNK